jgi:integrase
MGRPKTINKDLPPRMTARPSASGPRYFYNVRDGGKIPLGRDKAEALRKWADIEAGHEQGAQSNTLGNAIRIYRRHGLPGKAAKTQAEYGKALDRLDAAFGAGRFSQIKPLHIRQYLDKRSAPVAGNREIAVLSALWNWARERGHTDLPNPCVGVRRHRERAREIYVTDADFRAVWDVAVPELQAMLDIARLTGQREADILKMRRTDIDAGHLWIRQGKTGKRIGIVIEGELAAVLDRALTRQRAATGPYIVQTDTGQRLTYAMFRKRFDEARKAGKQQWQFRDLRPKAATDLDDVREAQQLLGHASESTTAEIYRRRRGEKVRPAGRS